MSSIEVPTLECVIKVEMTDSRGTGLRSTQFPKGQLSLLRSAERDIIIKASDITSPSREASVCISNRLHTIKIHSNFANEGRASIVITKKDNSRTQLLLSNCPPSHLKLFLNAVGVKRMAQCGQQDLAANFKAAKRPHLDKISPLTNNDLKKVRVALADKTKTLNESPKSTKSNSIKLPVRKGPAKENAVKPPAVPKTIASLFGGHSLNSEQSAVARAALNGSSLFFTGSAGTGKTHLLKYITERLPPQSTVVTASTGIAASHISGITLHTFAGIGSAKCTTEEAVRIIESNTIKAANWRRCSTLIIDEISMVDGEFFDKLEHIARVIRKRDEPFGGIQLILSGDFLQLPPVQRNGEAAKTFCFESQSWNSCVRTSFYLKRVMRQNESSFIKCLEKIRRGKCDDEVMDILKSSTSHRVDKDGIRATRLCTHKADVDLLNREQLKLLPGEARTFKAIDSHPKMAALMDSHCPTAREVTFKIGAQVILNKNIDLSRSLVNGSRGVIVKFEKRPGDNLANCLYPVVRFLDGKDHLIKFETWMVKSGQGMVSRTHLPLNCAWALSIHKSQGMSLDLVEISLSRAFECGQAYVALSRARTLQGLRVTDLASNSIKANKTVLEFYESLE